MTTSPEPRLLRGDCLEQLRTLPDNSISCLITDPPYYGEGQLGSTWQAGGITTRQAVKNLPTTMAFDPKQGEQLSAFLEPIAAELLRVCKPGTLGAVFSSPRLSHGTAAAFEEAGWWVRDQWVWRYAPAQPRAMTLSRFAPKDLTEAQLAALRLDQWKTPQATPAWESILVVQAPPDGTLIANWAKHGTGLLNCEGGSPTTVLEFAKPNRAERAEACGHPTPKPVALCRELVRRLCPPNGVLVDPFLGSGSTAVAAQLEGASWLGCELSSTYWPTIEARVSAAGDAPEQLTLS